MKLASPSLLWSPVSERSPVTERPVAEQPGFHRIETRSLDRWEIEELFEFLTGLPNTKWTQTDIAISKDRMMTSRKGTIVLYEDQRDEAIYAKLKWG